MSGPADGAAAMTGPPQLVFYLTVGGPGMAAARRATNVVKPTFDGLTRGPCWREEC